MPCRRSDLLAAAVVPARRAVVVARLAPRLLPATAALVLLTASAAILLRAARTTLVMAALAPLASGAAPLLRPRAALAAAVSLLAHLLAQLLHALLQAALEQHAPHPRPATAAAGGPLALALALPCLTARPRALFLAFALQLLAASLQAFAHRFEALLRGQKPLAHFGSRGFLAGRALGALPLLRADERDEQTEHEHQTFHSDHLTGRLEGRGLRLLPRNSHGLRTCEGSRRRTRRCHGPSAVARRAPADAHPAERAGWDVSGCPPPRPGRRRARRRRSVAR